MANETIFNEDALRAEIAKTWGEHGAHIEVFDRMRKQLSGIGGEEKTLDELLDCIRNLVGVFDTPIYRRKLSSIAIEAINIGKNILNKSSKLTTPSKKGEPIKYKGVWTPQYMAERILANEQGIMNVTKALESWAADIVEVNQVSQK